MQSHSQASIYAYFGLSRPAARAGRLGLSKSNPEDFRLPCVERGIGRGAYPPFFLIQPQTESPLLYPGQTSTPLWSSL